MILSRLIISIALAVMSVAGTAHSQDLMGFDRSSFGSVVLSRTQAVGTGIQLELYAGSYENEPIGNYSDGSIFAQIGRSVGRLDVLTDKGVFPCTAFTVSKKYTVIPTPVEFDEDLDYAVLEVLGDPSQIDYIRILTYATPDNTLLKHKVEY